MAAAHAMALHAQWARRRSGRFPAPGGATAMADSDGAVLAFDYGERRIGVAVGELRLAIAHPLDTIAFDDNRRRFEAITRLIDEWRPTRLVVGVPHYADGAPHPLEPSVARFARRLESHFKLPVERIDETLTSWQASRALSQAGVRARAQRPLVDRMAAREILETWFERSRSSQERA